MPERVDDVIRKKVERSVSAPGVAVLECAEAIEIRVLKMQAFSNSGIFLSVAQRACRCKRLLRVVNADHFALRDAVDAGYAPYVAGDGSVALPACSLVAWAEA